MQPCDAGDTNAEDGEGGDDEGEAEYEPPEKRDEQDGGQMDTDDCHVCPGTEAPPCFYSFPSTTVPEISMVHNRDAV